MVKKWMFCLSQDNIQNDDTESEGAGRQRVKLLQFNQQLHASLRLFKNNIEQPYAKCKWDRYKKYANEYELIFTTSAGFPSVCTHSPISRSFFKMWEVIHDFPEIFKLDDPQPRTSTFLAEGPGGFMEAVIKFRGDNIQQDSIYGITLLSGQRNIPNWKLKSRNLNKMNLLAGADGSGDLTRLTNLDSFVTSIGANRSDLVTADGGFDFSSDFNNQELMSMTLMVCEVYLALQIQKNEGTFFLKIYDIFTTPMMQLLYILKLFYKEITFIKPLTSRPANSEKYVLCSGHRKPANAAAYLSALRECIVRSNYTQLLPIDRNSVDATAGPAMIPVSFLQDIVTYNAHYTHRQILSIHFTLAYILEVKIDKQNDKFKEYLKYQLAKAIRWCNKYKLPVQMSSLREYRKLYF